MKQIALAVTAGVTIYASTGMNGKNQPDRMSSEAYYLADRGSRLQLLDSRYLFNVASYTLDFPERYMHTYDYAPEEAWLTYAHDLGGDTYRQQDYVFTDRRYFRVCLKRADGADFQPAEADRIDSILRFYSDAVEVPRLFSGEIEDTARKIANLKKMGSLVLAVLTDSHRTVNGTWVDTAANLLAVHQAAGFDAVVHLGDLTDGIVSRQLTGEYVRQMLADMQQLAVPVHVVLGNHDANYFHGNPDILSQAEQVRLYQSQVGEYKSHPEQPYYFTDFPRHGVRCIFLQAYDNLEQLRYGFDLPQIHWLDETLDTTPADFSIVIFSHDAPLGILDFWASEIRNSEAVMQVMEQHQARVGNILAYIHGHTHADRIYRKRSFPIVSIGCAKCEDMTEKKPPETETPVRQLGMASQELWDAVVIQPAEKNIQFVRFGAGKDRSLR